MNGVLLSLLSAIINNIDTTNKAVIIILYVAHCLCIHKNSTDNKHPRHDISLSWTPRLICICTDAVMFWNLNYPSITALCSRFNQYRGWCRLQALPCWILLWQSNGRSYSMSEWTVFTWRPHPVPLLSLWFCLQGWISKEGMFKSWNLHKAATVFLTSGIRHWINKQ